MTCPSLSLPESSLQRSLLSPTRSPPMYPPPLPRVLHRDSSCSRLLQRLLLLPTLFILAPSCTAIRTPTICSPTAVLFKSGFDTKTGFFACVSYSGDTLAHGYLCSLHPRAFIAWMAPLLSTTQFLIPTSSKRLLWSEPVPYQHPPFRP